MAKYVIIGGTGTLGTALTATLYREGNEIVIFSRDELKQADMRRRFPGVHYVLGDIRDKGSFCGIMKGAHAVFHVAALKHVDSGEANPVEFIKTNVLGTINVAEAALESGVKHVVFSSTDKAVLPVNTYGMTKGIAERYLLSLNSRQSGTSFSVFLWGNVLGSRGSVVHTFADSLRRTGSVNITDSRMTRYFIHIEDAVAFMLKNYEDAKRDGAMIPPMKAATVMDLAAAIGKNLGLKKVTFNMVGIRPGEKIHETVYSSHEICLRSDTAVRYTSSELETMLKRVI